MTKITGAALEKFSLTTIEPDEELILSLGVYYIKSD